MKITKFDYTPEMIEYMYRLHKKSVARDIVWHENWAKFYLSRSKMCYLQGVFETHKKRFEKIDSIIGK